jgi:LPXTG-site transpeptidase (sortase) family protein
VPELFFTQDDSLTKNRLNAKMPQDEAFLLHDIIIFMKQFKKYSLIILILIAAGVFFMTLYKSTIATNNFSIALPAESVDEVVKPVSVRDPVKLSIPALEINGPVDRVGITGGGTMAVPKSFYRVGWYEYGPRPGEGGNAVLAGHVNNGLGLSGIFARLSEIKTGDNIYVTDKNGKMLRFRVYNVKTYTYTDTASEVFKGDSTKSALVLITCEGKWIQNKKTYDKRLAVFAELVNL